MQAMQIFQHLITLTDIKFVSLITSIVWGGGGGGGSCQENTQLHLKQNS